jgi:hypothetical protein
MMQDPRMQQQQQQNQQQQQQQPQPTPQQQQHFQLALEKTQRLQQQNLQQQQQAQQQMQQQMAVMQGQHPNQGQMATPSQQQAQLPHPPPPMNMTAPSPQQPGQSPMVHHSSPAQPMRSNSMNGMSAPPPQGPPQNKAFPQMQTIIDNFPNLYKRKHAGQLQPEQEHLVRISSQTWVRVLMSSLINSYRLMLDNKRSKDSRAKKQVSSSRIISIIPYLNHIKCHR